MSKDHSLAVAVLTSSTMRRAVRSGPESILRISGSSPSFNLMWVPPTSMTRILIAAPLPRPTETPGHKRLYSKAPERADPDADRFHQLAPRIALDSAAG